MSAQAGGVLDLFDDLNGNTSSLKLDARVKKARATVAELIATAAATLSHLDAINPPTGPYWSGADDQEKLRASIARAQGGQS